jgi:DNA-binding protein
LRESGQLPSETASSAQSRIKQASTVRSPAGSKKGERIRIVGLGILWVRRRAARMGRTPAAGEPVPINASKKVAFRPTEGPAEAL